MFDERKRGGVRLLLAAEVPQERVAQQLGVSLRTVQRITCAMRERLENETADVFFFLLRLADRFDIDLVVAFDRKMTRNPERHPAGKVRSSNNSHTGF